MVVFNSAQPEHLPAFANSRFVATRCRVGQEACTVLETGVRKCIPRSPNEEYTVAEVYECDEGSDCPTGSICCSQHKGGGHCEPRVGNAPPLYCNSELCLPYAGAPCPKGTICQASGGAEPGSCAVHPVRATCAPGRRCGADAGLCVWTYATRSGHFGRPRPEPLKIFWPGLSRHVYTLYGSNQCAQW
jgi:hypothetical protein